jgi:hypothetical protein
MFLRQDQVLLLLPEHGAARLDLPVVQHLPNPRVLAQILAEPIRGPCGRCGERLVVVLQPVSADGAEDGAGALQATSRDGGPGRARCWRFGQGGAVGRLLLAMLRNVGDGGHEGGGPALPQQVRRLRFILGAGGLQAGEGSQATATEDASPLVLGHAARRSWRCAARDELSSAGIDTAGPEHMRSSAWRSGRARSQRSRAANGPADCVVLRRIGRRTAY